jgi:RNA polymerase sigma-70 factor, ECF subfamily
MTPTRALFKVSEALGEATLHDGTSLVERLQAGSFRALAEAYDLYHRPLRAFTQRLVGDDGAAEDVVQETFVALFQSIAKYDGSCSLKTFLMAVATNRARHHLRSSKRRVAAIVRFQNHTNAIPFVSPEERVEQKRLADMLSILLSRLPIDQRIAFVLCEVEERTSAEAAVIVGASEATVRTRLWHAKRKLRRALAHRGMK